MTSRPPRTNAGLGRRIHAYLRDAVPHGTEVDGFTLAPLLAEAGIAVHPTASSSVESVVAGALLHLHDKGVLHRVGWGTYAYLPKIIIDRDAGTRQAATHETDHRDRLPGHEPWPPPQLDLDGESTGAGAVTVRGAAQRAELIQIDGTWIALIDGTLHRVELEPI